MIDDRTLLRDDCDNARHLLNFATVIHIQIKVSTCTSRTDEMMKYHSYSKRNIKDKSRARSDNADKSKSGSPTRTRLSNNDPVGRLL